MPGQPLLHTTLTTTADKYAIIFTTDIYLYKPKKHYLCRLEKATLYGHYKDSRYTTRRGILPQPRR